MTDQFDRLIRERFAEDSTQMQTRMPHMKSLTESVRRRRRRRSAGLGALAAAAVLATVPLGALAMDGSPGPSSDLLADARTEASVTEGILPTYRFKEGEEITTQDVLLSGVLRFTDSGCPFVEFGGVTNRPLAFPFSFKVVGGRPDRQIVGTSGKAWGVEGESVSFGALPPQPGLTEVEGLCEAPDTNDLGALTVEPN